MKELSDYINDMPRREYIGLVVSLSLSVFVIVLMALVVTHP